MRIVAMGASGLIGKAIVNLLSPRHEVIKASVNSGDVKVDYTDNQSIHNMYKEVGSFDAVIATIGRDSHFGSFEDLSEQEFIYGIKRKLMGQINLVLIGKDYIDNQGSFTLSSGFLSHYPNPYSCATGPLNAAVDAFALSAAIALPKGIRINSVSPAPVVRDGDAPKGSGRVTPEMAAEAFVKCVEGDFTGQTVRVWNMEQ